MCLCVCVCVLLLISYTTRFGATVKQLVERSCYDIPSLVNTPLRKRRKGLGTLLLMIVTVRNAIKYNHNYGFAVRMCD